MFEAVDVATGVDPGPRPSVGDVSTAIDEAVALQAQIDALEGRKLLAVERARRAAGGCERVLLDEVDLEARRASARRRRELASRAFTADLATALRLSEQQASHLVDTAKTLADVALGTHPMTSLPEASALVELCRGRFSLAHASAIADTLADLPHDPPDAEADADDAAARVRAQVQAAIEAAVLPVAAHTTLTQLRRRLRRARDLAHPEPLTARHRRAATKRAVHLDPGADGMAWLAAYLPAPHAHAIHDRLTRTGRRAKDAGDCRTLDQLRADTLTDLLLATTDTTPSTTAGGPGHGALMPDLVPDLVPDLADLARRITPNVRVTVPVTTLLGSADPAELDGHGPLDADTATRLSAHAPSLRRLLIDPFDGRVLTTDPGTYTVPAALRALLQARDATCRFPGCARTATNCDLDHVQAWAHGGTTTAHNLAHLCRRHHVVKHQTAWHVTHGPDGTLTWTSPTGRTHHDRTAAALDPPVLDPLESRTPLAESPSPESPSPESPSPESPSPESPSPESPSPGPPPF